MTAPIHLSLPEPPSVNSLKSSAFGHRMQGVRQRNAAKRNAFFRAVEQELPKSEPPEKVRVDAHFRLHNLRDEDGLYGSLKVVLDALRCPREGEDFGWRHGIAKGKGYLRDDDPAHLELGEVTQEISRDDRGLELTITPISEAGSEAA